MQSHSPSVRDDAPTLDIVATALAAGHFSLLCNALRAAGLAEQFKGPGPFTVFAPTDAAFRKWSRSTLDALLKDRERLGSILGYHVVAGKIMARDLVTQSVTSLQGGGLNVVVGDAGVRVNDARVMKTDIEASNGVIHSIDTVLMPI
jgi:uncharacterized surface protein with fasciclin (FAS1) repeats